MPSSPTQAGTRARRRAAVRRLAGASVAALLWASGCGGGTTGPAAGNGICGHVEFAGGVDMVSHGNPLFHQFGFDTTGSMSVVVGAILHGIEVTFLDENAKPIPIPNDCDIMRLEIQLVDPTLAHITQDDGVRWRFNIVGDKAGTTTLTVGLWHDGHAHFTSQPITLTVVPTVP